ncbi:MAG: protein-disulfide reductase DsbD domain-containing protein [Paracoccaceae bacterium]
MILKPLFLALALTLPPALAAAQDLEGLQSAAIRTGWRTPTGSYMTALDLRLSPGWKTYWRAPGDAGIPPSFDWAGSDNIGAVRLHWPSPEVFTLNGMQTVGYPDALVLPIEVTPQDPARPVSLNLAVDLGICKDVCLPASLRLSATASGPGAEDAQIRAALAARPLTKAEAAVARTACTALPIADGLRLTAEITLPRFGPAEEVAVFETADPSIWISQSVTTRSGGTVTAISDLVGQSGAPFALERQGVTVTLISGGTSVEIKGCPAP